MVKKPKANEKLKKKSDSCWAHSKFKMNEKRCAIDEFHL